MVVVKSKLIFTLACFFVSFYVGISYAEDLKVEKVVDDVFCIHQKDTNSGFFKFKDKIYVVDSHFPTNLSEKQKELIRSQYKTEKIEALINTNINIDTIAGNQVFSGDAWILSSKSAKEKLSEKGESMLIEAKGIRDEKELKKIKIISADLTFEKEIDFYNGQNVLEVFDAQDVYSPGNLVVNIKNKNVLFAGLLFFNKIIPDLREAKLRDYQR
ncbi:hypothetical protein KKB18_11420, partial [bacterium]|nr:hypothetical protein [bacterium]